MNCHNQTAHIPDANDGTNSGNDFLWSLAVNAYPDVKPLPGALATRQSHFESRQHCSLQSAGGVEGS